MSKIKLKLIIIFFYTLIFYIKTKQNYFLNERKTVSMVHVSIVRSWSWIIPNKRILIITVLCNHHRVYLVTLLRVKLHNLIRRIVFFCIRIIRKINDLSGASIETKVLYMGLSYNRVYSYLERKIDKITKTLPLITWLITIKLYIIIKRVLYIYLLIFLVFYRVFCV